MTIDKYVHIELTKDNCVNIYMQSTKPNTALTTLTRLQQIVDSKKDIINQTGFSLAELACKIGNNYNGKLSLWKKLIDCFFCGWIFGSSAINTLVDRILIKSSQPVSPPPPNPVIPSQIEVEASVLDWINVQPMELVPVPDFVLNEINFFRGHFLNILQTIENQLVNLTNQQISELLDPLSDMDKCLKSLQKKGTSPDQIKAQFSRSNQLSLTADYCAKDLAKRLVGLKEEIELLDESNVKQILNIAEKLIPSTGLTIYMHLRIIAQESKISLELFDQEICRQLAPVFYQLADLDYLIKNLNNILQLKGQIGDFFILRVSRYYFEQKNYNEAHRVLTHPLHTIRTSIYQKHQVELLTNLAILFFKEKDFENAKKVAYDILRINESQQMLSETSEKIIEYILKAARILGYTHDFKD